ncbi:mitochondrial nicotinamide adenine dinucleotide transporter SLC25A51 [Ischnura elegans]|uniref:mitochondrial nicotinamide adenine dinucleotide transporter SLC25A51 n=1 Tax=Ischnura elegans TaxID=197161 RepID=UPI001ED8A217|nr:mitochondrial nicotinamide adenine dinucleotide transporter SLC25A51 [Ischnura elegans]
MNLASSSPETCDVTVSTETSSLKQHALGTPPITSFGPSPPISNPNLQLKGWKEFACGWGAAFINVTVTFPINKVMFRQMLHGVKTTSAIKQLYTEGIFYLYRGILPPLLQKTASVSIMFGCYEGYQKQFPQEMRDSHPRVTKTVAAVLAGCTEAILSPFERIQTLMQDKSYHGRFVNTAHAFREVASHYGVREFYRGIVPILCRNGPSNAAFFFLREEAQKPGVLFWMSSPNPSPAASALADFCSGALIGAFISTVFYPMNVFKTHMQIRLGGRFVTLREIFSEIYNERGSWREMYRGVHVNYTRALITWGVINVSYEALKKLLV